ncbi:MAG: thioredoxin fold domain-containing protein [Gemmatimonadaceae bacterium]|nr:thioredoxin fold domain-containing protein [Gemmatimonadaceae bacterium]
MLPMVPILIAGLVGSSSASPWARLRATMGFALGFAAVFVILGLSMPAALRLLPGLRSVVLAFSAVLLVLYGLKMMHVLQRATIFAWMDRSAGITSTPPSGDGAFRSFLLGAVFGFSWTPCAGPILGGVLTYVAASDGSTFRGGALLLAYAAGVAGPLLLVAIAAERVTPYLRSVLPFTRSIGAVSGLALVIVGLQIGAQAVGTSGWSFRSIADRDGQSAARQPIVETADATRQVLFFHSEHCPTCRTMQQVLPGLAEACRSSRWRLVSVDVDRSENRALVERFHVRAVPTLSLLDERGEEVEHLIGLQTPAHLREAIERTMAVACAADPMPRGGEDGNGGDGVCTIGKAC